MTATLAAAIDDLYQSWLRHRESQIAALLARGITRPETIARRLDITVQAAAAYLARQAQPQAGPAHPSGEPPSGDGAHIATNGDVAITSSPDGGASDRARLCTAVAGTATAQLTGRTGEPPSSLWCGGGGWDTPPTLTGKEPEIKPQFRRNCPGKPKVWP